MIKDFFYGRKTSVANKFELHDIYTEVPDSMMALVATIVRYFEFYLSKFI